MNNSTFNTKILQNQSKNHTKLKKKNLYEFQFVFLGIVKEKKSIILNFHLQDKPMNTKSSFSFVWLESYQLKTFFFLTTFFTSLNIQAFKHNRYKIQK